MKVAVVGLGAVGGLIAARLARAGHEVAGIARAATLERIAADGLRVESAGRNETVKLRVTADARELGPQELVVIALKAPSLPAAAGAIDSLVDAGTLLLPAMNGVPWWFLPAALPAQAPLDSVDPGGRLLQRLPLRQVLGCVVHLTCSSPAPGVVRHGFGERLVVGESYGGASARVEAVCTALAEAGFKAEASADVRREVWYKLWGNMTMNPVSALTGALTDAISDDPLVRGFILRCMAEAAEIGARVGCPIAQSGEERLDLTRELGGFRTSMLQDSEAGRALELDALVTAVHEIGARVGVATPDIGALLGLTRLMARTRGLYPPAPT
ncbi:MAG TPA: 2-dehydropantoate 2-reductase [Caldimonas sp.]|jgi:2-dehydropantoate 2-reductase|nr:2-dehydropantoate 2-reductase [Caldimonas sp.]HEX2539563.1 2-dehydropantoate 2-reductase [Caldimonas sp.]